MKDTGARMAGEDSKSQVRLDDLAARAGVSVSTVSRALNDSPAVNRITKQKIWKLARELDYPFRGTMAPGPSGAKGTIAIVVPRPQARTTQLDDPFLVRLIASIGEAAQTRGCDVLLSHISPTSFDDLLYAMDTCRTDGVIFIGQGPLHGAFNQLAAAHERFVVWGAELPDQDYCTIGSRNRFGGRRAAEHMLRLGREKLLFLGDRTVPEAHQRFHGFADAHEAAGIAVPDERIVRSHFEVESAMTAVESALSQGVEFDGIFAASDLIALGAMRGLRRVGRSAPDDVSIIGYDDIPVSRLVAPALTTVSQHVEEAGKLLVAKLLDTDGKPGKPIRTSTELIVRESCGA